MIMKFLLDANFLLAPVQFRVDIYSELARFGKHELYTLSLVLEELERMASGHSRKSRQAKLALALAKKAHVTVIQARGQADKAILRIAKGKFVVCTQDTALKSRLRKSKIPVVTIRQKKYLAIE